MLEENTLLEKNLKVRKVPRFQSTAYLCNLYFFNLCILLAFSHINHQGFLWHCEKSW